MKIQRESPLRRLHHGMEWLNSPLVKRLPQRFTSAHSLHSHPAKARVIHGQRDRAAWSEQLQTPVIGAGVSWSTDALDAAASAAPLLAAARSTTPKHGLTVCSPNGPGDRWSDFPPLVQAHLHRNDQLQHRRQVSLERARASPEFGVNSMRSKLVHAYLHAAISQAIKPLAITRELEPPVIDR
jgi:hypothetical protein